LENTLNYIIKKYASRKDKENFVYLENIGRNELAKIFSELHFDKGAEIGVDRGAYSEVLLRTNPKLFLYCIDSWSNKSYDDPVNTQDKMQRLFDVHREYAINRLSKYNCKIIHDKSLNVVDQFADNSLDFVYIDANHNFVNIANDLFAWSKKVRKGGIVSGHDYAHFPPDRDNHVKHVVDAYVEAFEIKPLFELGQDRYHSWFFVK